MGEVLDESELFQSALPGDLMLPSTYLWENTKILWIQSKNWGHMANFPSLDPRYMLVKRLCLGTPDPGPGARGEGAPQPRTPHSPFCQVGSSVFSVIFLGTHFCLPSGASPMCPKSLWHRSLSHYTQNSFIWREIDQFFLHLPAWKSCMKEQPLMYWNSLLGTIGAF